MLSDVYSKRILEFSGEITRLGRLADAHASATKHSKLCGSTVTVDIKMDGDKISDYAHEVEACALGRTSAAIMARHVVGSNADELRQLRETMTAMLKHDGPPPTGKWADLAVLQPVKDYPARHASTLLVFDALNEAMQK